MDCTWITIAFYFSLQFFLSIPSAETVTIPTNKTETDRLALLAFKAKITHDPFQVLSSWNDSRSFCNWQGVTCSPRRQRVRKLLLFSRRLGGSLSPHIGNLTFLKVLELRGNYFHGEIPPELGRLYRLRDLGLSTNLFVGNIPVNISHCTNLEKLLLKRNELEGKIPTELGSLSNLVYLALDVNNLTGGIPPFIGNLSFLRHLSLSDNNLGGSIPHSLLQLRMLSWFGIGKNMLYGTVPPMFYNISSLNALILSQNQLQGSLPPNIRLPNLVNFGIGGNRFSGTIPVSLFNGSGLEHVDMYDNDFSGAFPPEVGNHKRLKILALDGNRLENGKGNDFGFLTALMNCSNLQFFSMSNNRFGGALPNSIANLSNQLLDLHIGGNQIHGTIPSGIQNYLNLIRLGMENNFLTGSIPFSIGMLQKLQGLWLDGNKLSGQLPFSMGNMSHLSVLNLTNNNLHGEFVSDLTQCRFLQTIDFSYNNFNGPIPNNILELSSSLLYLVLAHNSFTGSLPIQLGNFKSLILLNLAENKMSGEIPSSIGGCWSLQSLYLNDNFFQGHIPTSFISLKDIRSVDLSSNNFSGGIPSNMSQLPLLDMNLSFNNFEGVVPVEGVFKNASAFSVLGNPKLCGGISELHLAACPSEASKKRKMSSILKVAFGAVLPSIVVALVAIFLLYRRRSPKAKPSSELVPGAHFERVSYQELHHATNGFSFTNLIGLGSFGSVYKGILRDDEEHVAIKVFNLIERGASKTFISECDALRKIRHRNLLKILTICSSVDFKSNEFKALVLKFMPNGNLENWLHCSSDARYPTQAFSLFRRLNIAIDVASALDYLHNHCETPIVHCDLKPSNILLDGDMTAHLGDFGLAKFLHQNTSNLDMSGRSSTSPRGTIGYIPPEYGTSTNVTTQGDLYAFGIMLLEMITGKRPTDEIFKDGLTLHSFSSVALPLRVMDIVDPLMVLEEDHHEVNINSAHQRDINVRAQACIVSMVKIGVACSVESQSERLDISDALMELHVIKDMFLGTRMQRHAL